VRWVLLVATCLLAASTLAHEVRPAYLELTETAPAEFQVTWKQPLLGDLRLPIDPVFPEGCADVGTRRPEVARAALIERWTLACDADSLEGADIRIAGLSRTLTDVLVRVVSADGSVVSGVLKPDAASMSLAGPAGVAAPAYLLLGIEHLLFGFDHILFVVGLMFLVSGIWPLIKTVTAFTLAHSITLALSTLGVVRLSQQPVEVLIALSILFLAVELARGARADTSTAVRAPWIVAFAFGLLHGFGFAGALADIGLPKDAAAIALLLFNVGVEIGQLAIVAVVLALVWALRRTSVRVPRWIVRLPIYGIGTVSSYWAISRLAALG